MSHQLTGPHDFGRDEREHRWVVECDNCGKAWGLPRDEAEIDEIANEECPA